MGIAIEPISDALGAELTGLDLTRPLDAATAEAVRKAWYDHQILLVRGQSLKNADHLRFCELFGAIQVERTKPDAADEHPGILYVSNVRQNAILPDGEMWFHTDQCYYEIPVSATCLYAIEVPSQGGHTRFANTYAAYETLPADVKRRIEGRKAMNVYDYAVNSTHRQGDARPEAPRWAHPVARTHPVTGRKALFVNRLMSEHIEGMDRAESDELLRFLFDHMERPEFVYEHPWVPGDMIIWDNRCTAHARTDFPKGDRRLLRRIAVEGERPI